MTEKFIFKQITDAFFRILAKHGNRQWAVDELEWLIYDVHGHEYYNLNDMEKIDIARVMDILKNN